MRSRSAPRHRGRGVRRPLGFALTLLVGAATAAGATGPVEHPTLVSLESARCSFCHEEILTERRVVHAPVAEDCTTCHEIDLGAGSTTVTLLDDDPALCLLCHDELTAAAELELAAPHFPVADGCLSCHDPHASDAPKLLLQPEATLCLECHDVAELGEPHRGQVWKGVECAACHSPHGSGSPGMLRAAQLHAPFGEGSCSACHRPPFQNRIRLRARGERLCLACHAEIAGETPPDEGSVHPALEGEHGRAGCLACHDPHLGPGPNLLLAAGPSLCSRCHGEIVAAARSETGHFAAADDCLTCHRPHTAELPRLLTEPAADLCALCHESDDPELVAAHIGADPAKLSCLACHSPHGTGNASLLAETLHEPLLDGCDTCHEGSSDRLAEGGDPDLCVLCHDDVSGAAATATVPHDALEVAGCTECHNPHASRQPALVKSPAAGPCADCHEEQLPESGESAHGAILAAGCYACHEPHGGDREHLLRGRPDELCLDCHGPAPDASSETAPELLARFSSAAAPPVSVSRLVLSADGARGHPVAGHRVLGVPTEEEMTHAPPELEGELGCLSCHDPHKGRYRLLRWDAATPTEACNACHRK